ncbi:MAG: DUF3817 domain-containing protein [Bacteroidetes bacterium]|nr:MAG: DUF3817 domain-containing protein [Bacteroidota bacterium]
MSFRFSKTPLGRFRMIALMEGVSFILLLMAMPLKYLYGHPEYVKVIGWIHGLLFILYVLALVNVKMSNGWSILKSVIAFLASLLPFGTFILDISLRKEENLPVS